MADLPGTDQVFLNKLSEIILANLENEDFGVNELASLAGFSHYTLSRKIQSITGKTITQFIRETRLLKALEMLKSKDITAAEVAYKTGFGSATYFNTCFNEFFGYPPGKVKKGEPVIQPGPEHISSVADPKRRLSAKLIITYISAAILVLSIVFYLLKITILTDSHVADRQLAVSPWKSIAVLPFKNLSDSAGNQYFVDGIAEDILTLLCRFRDLRVVSRTSVEQFRNSKMSTSGIAEKLKVKYIIEGSVQKSGNMFRLWIQLIDATTGHHLWAEVYDGKYSIDIFDFQSKIAEKVAASLNVVLTPAEAQKINDNPTEEILAYDLCIRGQELTRKWDIINDEQYLRLARNAFENALKIDPNYVNALLGQANVLLKSGSYDSALVYNHKVLKIDSENANALSGIGGYYLFTNNPDSALRYFLKSIESNPNDEKAFWNFLGVGQVFFMYRNEIIESLSSFQKAYDLGGYSWPEIQNNISLLFSSIGDYPKAFKHMHNALSMTSSCSYIRTSFYILNAREKYNEALAFIDSIGRITPCEQICDMMKFYLYTTQRDYYKADIFLNKAINSGYKLVWDDYLYKSCLYKGTKRATEDLSKIKSIVEREESVLQAAKSFWAGETALRAAAGYAILGNKKKAMIYLKLFEKKGSYDNPFPLKTFPGFDTLQSDPEFKAIVKRIENNKDSLFARVREMELVGKINL